MKYTKEQHEADEQQRDKRTFLIGLVSTGFFLLGVSAGNLINYMTAITGQTLTIGDLVLQASGANLAGIIVLISCLVTARGQSESSKYHAAQARIHKHEAERIEKQWGER